MAGCNDSGCLAEIAGALGVRFVASADLGRVGDTSVLTFKLIDAASAVVAVRASRRTRDDNALLDAVDDLAREVGSRVPEPTAAAPPVPAPRPAPALEAARPVPAVAAPPPPRSAPVVPVPARPQDAPVVTAPPPPPPRAAPVVPAPPRPQEAPVVVAPPAPPPGPAPAAPAPRVEASRRESPAPQRAPKAAARHWALRAGLSPMLGVLGLGLEYRFGTVGLSVGTGTHVLGGGLALGASDNDGGWYVDLHAVWVRSLVFPAMPTGVAGGFTAGWDWRPVPALSLKTGVGLTWNSAGAAGGGKVPLAFDLALGPVF